MTQRYVLLWNAPKMLSADDDERWVAQELDQLRRSTPGLDTTCAQTAGDDGPGWMLEISIGDDDDPVSIQEVVRDLVFELRSLRLRPRSFVVGLGVSRDDYRPDSWWQRVIDSTRSTSRHAGT